VETEGNRTPRPEESLPESPTGLAVVSISRDVRPRLTCRRASRKVLGLSASASERQHPDIAASGPAHRGEAWTQRD